MIKEILRQILSDRKEWLRYLKYKNALPKNPMHDDIYIVEFPKSGITWLQHIIGNIELQMSGKNESITFYNHHKYMPDIHQMGNNFLKRYGERTFIKSHAEYNPYYYFVIYLMRNPFDVMVSYYNFMIMQGYTKSFSCFVHNKKYGISNWKRHVNSWMYEKETAQRIHLLKYEDLITDTESSILNLYLNLGVNIDTRFIKNAIEQSKISNMIQSENHYRTYNPNYKLNFVGNKNKLKKEELLTDAITKYIYSKVEEEIRLFYPKFILT